MKSLIKGYYSNTLKKIESIKKIKNLKLYFFFSIVFLLLAPLFIGISSNLNLRFDLIGAFDPENRDQKFFVFPINFFIGILIFFFLKPFKINRDLIIIILIIASVNFFFLMKHGYFNFRLIKSSIGILTIFIYYEIFCKFNKMFFDFFPKIDVLKSFNFICLIIILTNILGFVLAGTFSTFGFHFGIYNFFDYYPILFILILLMNHEKFYKILSETNLIIILSFAILIIYFSQSRTILLGFFLTLFFVIIVKLVNGYFKKKIFQNINFFKYYISIYFLFIIFLFIGLFFSGLSYSNDIFKTLGYRNEEIIRLLITINYKNILLPHILDIVSESFHSQYFELYNWFGIFNIFFIYAFFKILNKIFRFNPLTISFIIIFYVSIGFFLLPFTHLYTGVILSYILSILSFRINQT